MCVYEEGEFEVCAFVVGGSIECHQTNFKLKGSSLASATAITT